MSNIADQLVAAAEGPSTPHDAVAAVLKVLVEKAFGVDDEEVDYGYACEELAMDACDSLRALGE